MIIVRILTIINRKDRPIITYYEATFIITTCLKQQNAGPWHITALPNAVL